MTSMATNRPRIGVPYRTTNEQVKRRREAYDKYLRAVEAAGGVAVEISLDFTEASRDKILHDLDGFLLPGSPADLDPAKYGAAPSTLSHTSDPKREQTDFALLKFSFKEHKPVLAICYGIQSLNVFLGGSLIQDIAAEVPKALQHEWKDRRNGNPEPVHAARFEAGSRLARLARASEAEVNSSHHQAIREPAEGLRVVAHAPDGVIEAVEWARDDNWVTGVQWHPERRPENDALSRALFQEFVHAAKAARIAR